MSLTNAVVHFKSPTDYPVLVTFTCRSGHKVRCIWMTYIHSGKTLTYIERKADANEGVRHTNVDDKEYFQSLVDEVLKADPTVVRRISRN